MWRYRESELTQTMQSGRVIEMKQYQTIGVAEGVLAGDRAVLLPIHSDDKERERQEKLARIEKLKAETRRLKQLVGICAKCGCDHCPGCDYDHDC